MAGRLLGVDACKGGWVGVCLDTRADVRPTRWPSRGSADHAAANEVNRAVVGMGLSVQAYGFRHRIFEVELWPTTYDGRVADGRAESLPSPPETFADGWPTAIWF